MNVVKPLGESATQVDPTLVRALARECGQPETEVERVLREELGRLSAGARIKNYVTVLATSRVRTRLREDRSGPY
jgi:hypothetical protein